MPRDTRCRRPGARVPRPARRPSPGLAQRGGYFPDVTPDVGESVRFQRDNPRPGTDPFADGGLDVLKTDPADLALRLRDDQIGLECSEPRDIDPVDGEALLNDRPHAPVDLEAPAADRNLRAS